MLHPQTMMWKTNPIKKRSRHLLVQGGFGKKGPSAETSEEHAKPAVSQIDNGAVPNFPALEALLFNYQIVRYDDVPYYRAIGVNYG